MYHLDLSAYATLTDEQLAAQIADLFHMADLDPDAAPVYIDDADQLTAELNSRKGA